MLFPPLSFVLSLMCLCRRPVLEWRGPLQVSLGRGGHHRTPVPEPGPHRMDVFSVDGWFLNGGRNFWQPRPAAQEAWWRLLDVLCCHCSACPLASRDPSGVVGQEGLRCLRGQTSCILGDHTYWIGALNLPGEPWVGLKGWAESTLRTCSQLFAMHRNCWSWFSSIVLLFRSLRSRGLQTTLPILH